MGMGVDVEELAELGLYREAKLVDRYVGQGLEEPDPEPSEEADEAGPAPRLAPADDKAGGTCG